MRDFILRRLRRAPIIGPLWDEYERMRTAHDTALAGQDAVLADGYVQMFFRREAALRDFRTPGRLAVSPAPLQQVLVIGSCFAETLVHHLPRAIPGAAADFMLFQHYAELPPEPPRPIDEYDFQLVVLPLRVVMPEHGYLRLSYSDLAAHQAFYDEAVERLLRLLGSALAYSRDFGKLSFVANFLVPQQNPLGRLLPTADLRNPVYFCQKLNEELEKAVAGLTGVHILDVDNLAASFGKRWVQDNSIWAFSHGAFANDWDADLDAGRLDPVTPLSRQTPLLVGNFMMATWDELAAMYRTVRQADPVKLVVVDLDDTLWRGVAADQDTLHSDMTEGWPLGFVEALQYARKRGMLLAIISKNDPALIERVWPDLYGGRLELADFAVAKINWNPKVENMEELLGEVNLLPRNTLFIDDNPVERAAMSAAFPEMRVIGGNPYEHRRLLLWAPEMQVATITGESARRTEMVRSQVDREHSRQRLSRADFIASLNLRLGLLRVTGPGGPRFARTFELLNKTNQFNTTGKRWTIEELSSAIAAGTEIYAFDVADNYTRYGLVGVILVEGTSVVQFVMSCRVVGLDVEVAAIALLARHLTDARPGRLRAITRDTDANLLSRDLWRRCGFTRRGDIWEAEPDAIIAAPRHIQIVEQPAATALAGI